MPITLNGRLVQLGRFADIVSSYTESKDIRIEFTIEGTIETSDEISYSLGQPREGTVLSVACSVDFGAEPAAIRQIFSSCAPH